MTKHTAFDQQLESARRHLEALRRHAGAASVQSGLLRDALAGLANALEEIQVSAEELREREAKTHAIVDAAVDGIITIDEHGLIESFNPAAERLFGYDAAEAIGHNIKMLTPSPHTDDHDDYIARYLATGAKKIIGIGREVIGQRKGGTTFPMHLAVSELHLGERRVFTGIVHDLTQRKQVEERLARQAHLLANVNDAVVATDRELLITAWNHAAEAMYGWKAEEVVGRPSREVLRAGLPAADGQQVLRTLKEAGQWNGELIQYRRDGTPIYIEAKAIPLRDEHGHSTGFVSVNRDITERKRAERRLATQHAVTRVLAQSASLAEATPNVLQAICEGVGWEVGELWHVDTAANLLRWEGTWHVPSVDTAEFEAVSHQTTFASGDGLPGRVWMTGQPAWLIDVAAVPRFLRAAAAAKLGLHGALAFPICTHGTVIGVLTAFTRATGTPDPELLQILDALGNQIGDFIARKRAEEALRESEHRFTQFMRHLPGVAFMKDVDGRYVYVNRTFEELYHRRLSEYVGRTDDDVWPPAIATQLKENDQLVVRTRKVLQTTETIPHDDGLHHWLVSKFPVFNENGAPSMVAGVGVDITERKRAETQLVEVQKLAQQRERLADVGVITAKILHDLANPLAGLSMQAQLILRRASRDPEQPLSGVVQSAEHILSEVRRLDSLIREFMDFAREQRLELQVIRPHRFLQGCLDLWEPVATARGIALTLEGPAELPTLHADEEKLRRVFDNLIRNAVEAIEHGPGHIRVRIDVPAAEKIRISVEDTGPGIPETLQVFRLFETTKPNGTGLGLAIARQIVQAHGGTIEFAPRKPHGTVFHVELPRSGPPMQGDDSSPDR